MNQQLDLFEHVVPSIKARTAKPSCEVIPFPVERETALVRQMVRQLERKHGPTADKWWQTQCRRLYARLRVQGIADAESRAAVDRFARAVYAEMHRLTYRGQRPRGAV